MKLRNKKTGEICDFLGTYSATPFFGMSVDYHNGEPKCYEYNSLAELNEEWEDYTPKEPLIKDEKIRKAIEYLFPKYALVHIEKRGDKRLFEFGGVRVEINAPNENAIKHGLTYTIPELCGEDEE